MKRTTYALVCLSILAGGIGQDLTSAPQAAKSATKNKKNFRDFDRGFTSREKETILWIVNTLAWENMKDIIGKRKELKKEGKKINGIHPLRFLEIILTDEKAKCGMFKIRTRIGLIKNDFFEGITDSLKEESDAGNLKPKDVQYFAGKIKIDPVPIQSLLQQKKWTEFVDYLIDNLPRENDPQRYNM